MQRWTNGEAYDPYMGRWSHAVAAQFLPWLAVPKHATWVDVGSGTGVVIRALLDAQEPTRVMGIDRSAAYLAFAQHHITDPRVAWVVGEAEHLPVADASWDVVVAGLLVNFVPHPDQAVREWRRVVRSQGTVAAYVWDYVDGMPLNQVFWAAVAQLQPDPQVEEERHQFDQWQPSVLTHLWQEAGLVDIQTTSIHLPMVFADFADFWTPFLGGQGTAPEYYQALPETMRIHLRETLHAALPLRADGSLHLAARAWAIQGRVA
ncbi:MAG: methyltransferase domain-containing protein [Ktedonobacterales bacterium]|nr:methyltransferase domain-containing protein [Ktedonobacterales bacterium]